MCRALLSGFLHHLENVILFIRTQVAFEMNFCISVQECPADYLDTPKQALSANSCTTYSYEATYTLKRSGAEKFDQNHFRSPRHQHSFIKAENRDPIPPKSKFHLRSKKHNEAYAHSLFSSFVFCPCIYLQQRPPKT